MDEVEKQLVDSAKQAALEVLLNNNKGNYKGLPRTAAWGYPEPYTRDLMIAALGVLVSDDDELINSLRIVLETLAQNQNRLGHIPSLVHDPDDRGASDCTPLFLMGVGMWRKKTGDKKFLKQAAEKAMLWMEYQSPGGRVMVGQLPTSDWRDEQWVLGYGLFVNTVVYTYLRLLDQHERAEKLLDQTHHFTIKGETQNKHVHGGLVLRNKPYYAMWSYKVYRSERFDLLGNSIAILSGMASKTRASQLVSWIETECDSLRYHNQLGCELPPNFFPYIKPGDPDWIPRYERFNKPGEYHNGGIWPFICGFYVSAIVATGNHKLAEKKLVALSRLVQKSASDKLEFGFNEWHQAQDANPKGQDWQTWSAAMYLYAAHCVENKTTPFFDDARQNR